jgi:maltooligosyltrehalose trehalohydrolase
LKREVHVIAECDRNDIRTVKPANRGGYGFAAQWNDDFHHALHAALTHESTGYYQDFGKVSQIARSLASGYVYQGEYSKFRLRSHGSESKGVNGEHFVGFIQNHDQIGNRLNGERLGCLADFETLKVAAGVMLLSPFLPLIFMGEEYGESSPFLYFVSHQDAGLIEAVRQGRKAEFKGFRWSQEPPDPQDPKTFARSRLRWELQQLEPHKQLREFYRELLRIRRHCPALASPDMSHIEATAFENERALCLRRWHEGEQIFACFNFGPNQASVKASLSECDWTKVLNSRDQQWGGPGSALPDLLAPADQSLYIEPFSFALYRCHDEEKRD